MKTAYLRSCVLVLNSGRSPLLSFLLQFITSSIPRALLTFLFSLHHFDSSSLDSSIFCSVYFRCFSHHVLYKFITLSVFVLIFPQLDFFLVLSHHSYRLLEDIIALGNL